MVADTHMHNHPSSSPTTSHARATLKKRKRLSDNFSLSHSPPPLLHQSHLHQPQQSHAQSRQHARKSSLDNRVFSINTRRSLDIAGPVDAGTHSHSHFQAQSQFQSQFQPQSQSQYQFQHQSQSQYQSLQPTPRSQTQSQPQPRCPDWILQQSGVHYTRNKSWFYSADNNEHDYIPLNIQLDSGIWCQGIGTVRLAIKCGRGSGGGSSSINNQSTTTATGSSPTSSSNPTSGPDLIAPPANSTPLILTSVLHIPKAICNALSLPLLPHIHPHPSHHYPCRPATTTPPSYLLDTHTNQTLLLTQVRGLSRLALAEEENMVGGGATVTESFLEESDDEGGGGIVGRLLDLRLVVSEADVVRIEEIVRARKAGGFAAVTRLDGE